MRLSDPLLNEKEDERTHHSKDIGKQGEHDDADLGTCEEFLIEYVRRCTRDYHCQHEKVRSWVFWLSELIEIVRECLEENTEDQVREANQHGCITDHSWLLDLEDETKQGDCDRYHRLKIVRSQ